ncbi:NAD(P)-binding protein [Setomelanomma holmii]|uniref:NAD(P)-binding protein n=1 Tax=Setomelanomma holmii TaxID=210430 RepID=A0A9P4GZH3_9PLEO|nr:NAD(P)-binding protein [Setomelanomma holmii]
MQLIYHNVNRYDGNGEILIPSYHSFDGVKAGVGPLASPHANPQGPGDARPIALQIVKDNDLLGKSQGKVALVTALKAAGVHVFGAVCNLPKAAEALKDDIEPGKLELLELDMNSPDSVRECAAQLLAKSDKLNILVTNAGIMMPPEGRTKDGFESQFGTNHLAHFLLFQLLKPALLTSATPDFGSRIVCLSSVGHRGGEIQFDNLNWEGNYDPVAAHAQSKLASVYMANEIERHYGSKNLHAWSVMPGGIWTGLQASLPQVVVDQWKSDAAFQAAFKSPEQGAATSVWAAIGKDLEGQGGKYLEDCAIAGPATDASNLGLPGYAPWAFDEEKEGRLWKVSSEMVGIDAEE